MSSSCYLCAKPISECNWYQCSETGRGANKGKPHLQVDKTCMAIWAKTQDEEGKSRILCAQPGCNTDISHLLPTLKRAVHFLDRHPVVAMSAVLLPTQASRYIWGDWGGIGSEYFASIAIGALSYGNKISERSFFAMLSGGAVSLTLTTVSLLTNATSAHADGQKNVLLVIFVALHIFSLIAAVGAVWGKRVSHIDKIAALCIPLTGLHLSLNTILKLV